MSEVDPSHNHCTATMYLNHHPPHHVTRRTFVAGGLKSTLALGMAAALSPKCMAVPGQAARPAPKLRFGFTTYQRGKDWDLPMLIQNLQTAQVYGAELRTSLSYAHGVELNLTAAQRREVRQRFADSPIALVGLASGERLDWPDPARLEAAIEAVKAHVELSHDLGSSGVRVFPNQFHPGVPREKTIAQIGQALNRLGALAADDNQEVRLEAHGNAGELSTLRAIMEGVTAPRVRVKLNSDARDVQGLGFEHNFNLVKHLLGRTLHLHNLKDTEFPYQLQTNLLVKMGWDGWALLEASDAVPDRLQALIEQRQIWERLVANAHNA